MLRAVVHAMRTVGLSVIAASPLAGPGIADDTSVNEVAQGNKALGV